ncbi:hypothetical protein CC79DRAFT_1371246 [Sarocladium strictum]
MANHYHYDNKKQHNLQTGYPSAPDESFYSRNYNTTSDEPVHYNNHTVTDRPAYYSNYITTPEDNPPDYYTNPTIPTTPSSSTLPKLIAIPATSSKLGSPFLRAYPPILHSHQIPQETFLSFIDHLNRVAVASPPVQVLGLAGNIVGMVPLHTAQIVGGAVNAAATLTTVAMSKGRVEMLLRQVNRDVFGPRGLCARIAKLEAVAEMSGMPILNAEGKVDKNSSILGPLESMDDQTSLNALSPWLSPLQIESLPAIEQQTNFFSKMHSTVSERQRTKEEKKILKDRNKMHEDWVEDSRKARADFEKDMQKLDREEEKLRYKGKDSGREMGKIQREREKVEEKYEKEMRKVEKERRKDDKEEELVRKILFLVIQPAQAVN